MRARRFTTLVLSAVLLAASTLVPAVSLAGAFSFSSHSVYPNPFFDGDTVRFQLSMPKPGNIRISVYNIQGALINTIWEGWHAQGESDVPWDGLDRTGAKIAPGVYICVLFADGVAVKSVKVIKMGKRLS
jgi:flagellar hook assembly protein FlgD